MSKTSTCCSQNLSSNSCNDATIAFRCYKAVFAEQTIVPPILREHDVQGLISTNVPVMSSKSDSNHGKAFLLRLLCPSARPLPWNSNEMTRKGCGETNKTMTKMWSDDKIHSINDKTRRSWGGHCPRRYLYRHGQSLDGGDTLFSSRDRWSRVIEISFSSHATISKRQAFLKVSTQE
jgi:hypothetical protein